MLKIELVFKAGRWYEQNMLAGYFSANMLAKGTSKKTSFEIARIFDQYGAHLEISPGLDFVSVSLYALSHKLPMVLALLVEVLTDPSFAEDEFRQLQQIFLQSLSINNEKTSYVASQHFRRNLFGNNHPYGTEVTAQQVEALDVAQLRSHFNNFFHSPLAFVSGKITPEAGQLIQDHLQGLPVGNAVSVTPHEVSATSRNEHTKKADSVQASVRMGVRSLMRGHPDYVPVLFVSHILGGYFGSRLMKNIREDKGLTYGISASIHALKNDSYLLIGADVNKENVDLTYQEIGSEIRKLRTTSISPGELETTRNHFIGSLQSEITTPFAHAEKIKTLKLFGLTDDHHSKMISRIERITPEEILATSEKYFQEDIFFRVAVG